MTERTVVLDPATHQWHHVSTTAPVLELYHESQAVFSGSHRSFTFLIAVVMSKCGSQTKLQLESKRH